MSILQWLKECEKGVDLSEYAPFFSEQGFEDFGSLQDLNEEELQEIREEVIRAGKEQGIVIAKKIKFSRKCQVQELRSFQFQSSSNETKAEEETIKHFPAASIEASQVVRGASIPSNESRYFNSANTSTSTTISSSSSSSGHLSNYQPPSFVTSPQAFSQEQAHVSVHNLAPYSKKDNCQNSQAYQPPQPQYQTPTHTNTADVPRFKTEDANQFWSQRFQQLMDVSTRDLAEELVRWCDYRQLMPLRTNSHHFIRQITEQVIAGGESIVTFKRFNGFLFRFGPSLVEAVTNCIKCLIDRHGYVQKWFHSFLATAEVTKMFKKADQFLVKCSDRHPYDTLLIVFSSEIVNQQLRISNWLIEHTEQGYGCSQGAACNCQGQKFERLPDLLKVCAKGKRPIVSSRYSLQRTLPPGSEYSDSDDYEESNGPEGVMQKKKSMYTPHVSAAASHVVNPMYSPHVSAAGSHVVNPSGPGGAQPPNYQFLPDGPSPLHAHRNSTHLFPSNMSDPLLPMPPNLSPSPSLSAPPPSYTSAVWSDSHDFTSCSNEGTFGHPGHRSCDSPSSYSYTQRTVTSVSTHPTYSEHLPTTTSTFSQNGVSTQNICTVSTVTYTHDILVLGSEVQGEAPS
mmetsp:Transcript_25862/g.36578  ORF Transcript_25862/g.36578 Transcript_25862/m.36578 type:complete len:623 (+) Transcript_25862:156-2024(+)